MRLRRRRRRRGLLSAFGLPRALCTVRSFVPPSLCCAPTPWHVALGSVPPPPSRETYRRRRRGSPPRPKPVVAAAPRRAPKPIVAVRAAPKRMGVARRARETHPPSSPMERRHGASWSVMERHACGMWRKECHMCVCVCVLSSPKRDRRDGARQLDHAPTPWNATSYLMPHAMSWNHHRDRDGGPRDRWSHRRNHGRMMPWIATSSRVMG